MDETLSCHEPTYRIWRDPPDEPVSARVIIRAMKTQTPVRRLMALTSVTGLLAVALLLTGAALDTSSAARNAVMATGAFVLLATAGFAWALARSVVSERRSPS